MGIRIQLLPRSLYLPRLQEGKLGYVSTVVNVPPTYGTTLFIPLVARWATEHMNVSITVHWPAAPAVTTATVVATTSVYCWGCIRRRRSVRRFARCCPCYRATPLPPTQGPSRIFRYNSNHISCSLRPHFKWQRSKHLQHTG